VAYRSIGELDRRVQILTPVYEEGVGGDPAKVASWSVAHTVWARYESKVAGEQASDGRLRSKTSALFTIRHGHEVDSTMRVRMSGRDYRIESVAEVARNRTVEISAESIDESAGG
tara:strand:- start:2731 stop:3075 length:345 start_codon:yes stop_codon:yes gene_type:complete